MKNFATQRFAIIKRSAEYSTLGLGTLALLTAAGIGWIVVRAVTRPIATALRFASQVAEGDFTARGENRGRVISVDMAHLRDLSGAVIGQVEVGRDITNEELLRKDAAEALVRARMQAVASLEGIVGHLSHATEDLSAQIDHSESGAEQTAQRMTETATAMEQMNATVLEVARNAGDASSSTHIMFQKAREGATIVNQVADRMHLLHEAASGLHEDMILLDQQAEGIGRDPDHNFRYRRPDQSAGPERGH